MSKNLEIEFKIIVTKEKLEEVKKHFNLSDSDSFIQKNYYFDTEALDISKIKSSLRIREKEAKFELTLKRKLEVGVLEINQDIKSSEAMGLIKDSTHIPGEVYDTLKFKNVKNIACSTTKRIKFDYLRGEIFLDETKYKNSEDFEIEFEASDYSDGLEDFLKFLDLFNLERNDAPNKIYRAYKDYNLV